MRVRRSALIVLAASALLAAACAGSTSQPDRAADETTATPAFAAAPGARHSATPEATAAPADDTKATPTLAAPAGAPQSATPEATAAAAAVATTTTGTPVPAPAADNRRASQPGCTGGRITFHYLPVDLEASEYVRPLGSMSGSHVTPVDHQYFQNFKQPQLDIDVYSPAAGTVTSIQHMNQTVSEGAAQAIDDYRLVIEHTCTISSIFIHVGTLEPALAAAAPPPGEHASVNVALQAGQLIGTFRSSVDYSVVDIEVTLDGLLRPEHYAREPWKIHSPDPFDYFAPELREQLVGKSLRSAEPIGGRLDYDIDGRLVGNWFLEGTNGYGGVDRDRYWSGHLSIVYDYLDPSHIAVSIGTFDGVSAQFGVRGNAPDPADVSIESGPVMYELVQYEYWIDGEPWDRASLVKGLTAANSDAVHGVVLFEVLEGWRLRVETFPGLAAAQVDGFTQAALIYER